MAEKRGTHGGRRPGAGRAPSTRHGPKDAFLSVRVRQATKDALLQLAKEQDATLSDILDSLIKGYLS